jgi:hypothetical protein
VATVTGREGASRPGRHGWLLVAAVVVAAGVVVAVSWPRSGGGEPSLPIEGDASSLVADVTNPDGVPGVGVGALPLRASTHAA